MGAEQKKNRVSRVIAATLVVAAMLGCLTVASAVAAGNRPDPLIQFPSDGLKGADAGQLELPRSIATSPVNGEVYVAGINARVDVFTAWGEFVRAFGWKVNASNPEEKLQVCTASTGCQKGSEGKGNGQFAHLSGGIAIDDSGNVYVGDLENSRVQKFSSTGEFLLAFGSAGTGDGQFSNEFGSYIAISPDNTTVYVGDRERIEEFGADGTFKGQFTFKALHEESAQFPEEGRTRALAVDPNTGVIYVVIFQEGALSTVKSVFKLNPETGELLGSLTAPKMKSPIDLATDSDGNLYVINASVSSLDSRQEILKFDATGNKLIPSKAEEDEKLASEESVQSGGAFLPFEPFAEPNDGTTVFALATGGACGAESDDLYVAHLDTFGPLAYVKAYGPPPQNVAKCPPPPAAAPEVADQYATSVGTDSAVLGAAINPHYALDTTYYLQYGTGKCSEGGCGEVQPLPPGASLPAKVSDSPLTISSLFLSDLTPGTVYHYRFVTQSSGGGPIYGLDPDGDGPKEATPEAGLEGTFTTFSVPKRPPVLCANQAFRTGASAGLSDCRAYEMVSPPKRSPAGDIVGLGLSLHEESEVNQSASNGERLAYTSEYAFGDAVGAPGNSEYIASRQAGGWSTHAISPSRGKVIYNNPNIKLDVEEKAFTADLCLSWVTHVADPPLSSDAVPGFSNLYQRSNCGAEGFRSLTTVAPTSTPANGFWFELQGFSADGSRSVFRAKGKLGPEAPELGEYITPEVYQLYESGEGGLRFVCRMPDGTPYEDNCSAGTQGDSLGQGRGASVAHAVSADGSRVYWTTGSTQIGRGPLYLRENAAEEQSVMSGGECAEEVKACTYAVSTGKAQFWTAAADGSVAFYGEVEGPGEERLREFNAVTRKSKTIAQGMLGVAGASEDGSQVYFVSTRVIGGQGEAGKPNLYLRDGGTTTFVATLSKEDQLGGPPYLPLNPVSSQPLTHGARVSADGRQLLFASDAMLTDYDNRDVADGQSDVEVYLYEGGSAGPRCISCNPSGARPTARQLSRRGVSALIPVAENQLYTPRAVSANGSRVFFDSFEDLLARDTNGKRDTYEWERAAGQAGCEALGAELYVPAAGGCLSLISSGESQSDSEFIDASATGRDVFFRTSASLLPEDSGLIDIYDARELGGFAPKPGIPPACEGEACQGPLAPPNDPTPASATFQGAGNVAEGNGKCRRGKTRRKGRCVAKKHSKRAQHQKRVNRQRRSGR